MRTALVLGAALALLAAAQFAVAQTSPPPPASGTGEVMEVTSEVYIYSGPGDKFYPTDKLGRGERVLKLRKNKDPDWLEIIPPARAYSWISSRWLQRSEKDARIGIVKVPAGQFVPVMPAGISSLQDLNVESARVEGGTLVILLDSNPPPAGPDGTLVRIAPTPGEVRYIKANAVAPAPAGQVPSGVAQGTAGSDPLLLQQQRLYQQAQTNPNVDPASRQQALQHLQQAQALLQASASPQGNGAAMQMPGNPNTVAGMPGYAPGQLVSNSQPPQQNTTLYNAGAAGVAPAGMKWSSYGVLQKTAFQIDGKQMYRLLDTQGKPILYASPEPGKSLEPYVGQLVALYGPSTYRSDDFIRSDFMTVSYIAPAQPTKAGR
jgi:hypothetical protein